MLTDDHEAPLEDRVSAALSAAADTQPTIDDWPSVLARKGEPLRGLDEANAKAGRYRPLLLAVAVVAVVGVATVAVFASNTDSGDESVSTVDLAAASEATQASTARTMITLESNGGPETQLEGEIDFDTRSAYLRGDLGLTNSGGAEMDPGKFLEELPEMFEVFEIADALILIGEGGYIRSGGTWFDLGSDMEGSGDRLDVFSPATILDQVAKLGQVRTVGPEEVRGAQATHFTATDQTSQDRYDIWINDDGQVVRIIETTEDPEPGLAAKTTTDLFDFGTPVTIETPTEVQPLPLARSTGGDIDVNLREVASGNEADVSWTLSTGEMADGRRCVQVDTDPVLAGEVVDLSLDGTESISYEAPAGSLVGASCGPESVNGPGSSSGATLLTVGGKDGDVHYLAGILEDGAEVAITFPDGRAEQLEDHEGAFIVTFSGDDWPTQMSGTNATCELQGDETMSGTDNVC